MREAAVNGRKEAAGDGHSSRIVSQYGTFIVRGDFGKILVGTMMLNLSKMFAVVFVVTGILAGCIYGHGHGHHRIDGTL